MGDVEFRLSRQVKAISDFGVSIGKSGASVAEKVVKKTIKYAVLPAVAGGAVLALGHYGVYGVFGMHNVNITPNNFHFPTYEKQFIKVYRPKLAGTVYLLGLTAGAIALKTLLRKGDIDTKSTHSRIYLGSFYTTLGSVLGWKLVNVCNKSDKTLFTKSCGKAALVGAAIGLIISQLPIEEIPFKFSTKKV